MTTSARRRWRLIGGLTAGAAVGALALAAVLEFLAPNVSYVLRDRGAEWLSGRRHRTYRVALGATTGSYYRFGGVLNKHLQARAGYQLELVATGGVPENVGALTDPARGIDFAAIESSSDEAVKADGLYGLSVVGSQYFFVVAPEDSPVREIRELKGPVNPGVRAAGHAPTLGEKVLEYYGLLDARGDGPPAVSIVRPAHGSILNDFAAGHMTAATRTQFLHADLVDQVLGKGGFRLVPIRDHEALARALPGTQPGVIPAGAYGPGRRIPAEPVPTLTVNAVLAARGDVPGRVVRDLLETVYDPRFQRDLGFELNEQNGRNVGAVPLHPAADIYYRRNALVTSDRIGRLSFVASVVGASAAALQFLLRYRHNERRRARRRLLQSELAKLDALRRALETSTTDADTRALMSEADDVLSGAEQDAAAELLDADGIQSLRSMHGICRRARPATPAASPPLV
jgi:TRAP-type uncharacterized transport system substrate-binding protein